MSSMFEDVLKIIGLDEDDIKLVKKAGIKSFTNVKTLSKQQFAIELITAGLGAGQVANMEAFRQWYSVEYRGSATLKTQTVAAVFTEEVWIKFLDNYDPDNSSAQTAPAALTATTTVKPKKFKLETKGLPTMPKNETIQDKYSIWEEQLLAHLGMGENDLTNILDDAYVVPTSGNDLVEYNVKDKLIKNAMLLATCDTHAYAFVDTTKSGKDIFFAVRKAYCGKDHMEHKAQEAFSNLQKLQFSRQSRLSANAFVAKFLENMKAMDKNGTPLYLGLRKSTFLSKITHPSYTQWREVWAVSYTHLTLPTILRV